MCTAGALEATVVLIALGLMHLMITAFLLPIQNWRNNGIIARTVVLRRKPLAAVPEPYGGSV